MESASVTSGNSISLEVVVKLAERCNINCSYCYMFNQGNTEYRARPSIMPASVVEALARFLANGARAIGARRVHVVFHGGEPMMAGSRYFDEVCEVLSRAFSSDNDCLRYAMQTNATLVSPDWIEVLEKHRVGIGVSIDGPAEYHDQARRDRKGNGTHAAVVDGIRRMQGSRALSGLGALAVVNPRYSGKVVFDHLVEGLGLRSLNFLLPMETHDSFDFENASGYGDYLIEVFRAWAQRGDEDVKVRFVTEALQFLAGGATRANARDMVAGKHIVLIVDGDGSLEANECRRGAPPSAYANVADCTLSDFLATEYVAELEKAGKLIPTACAGCCWANGCRGSNGLMINRFSSRAGYNNPSIFCAEIKRFYGVVAASLVHSGVSPSSIIESLNAPTLGVMAQSSGQPGKRGTAGCSIVAS
ncbi:Anaerobic sulfatase-maturating enzyme [Burkholderiales bacterium]|nr:MAG: radical SAM protein [Burkholderiales bacterium]CAG0948763.1 Anaerobic sulfatase-maturating enzyme [Burkholderiales bacterium]